MSFDNLVKLGLLHKEPTNRGEILLLLAAARRGLQDSGVSTLSVEGRFVLAYQAALQLCNAGLRFCGYRTSSNTKGAHATAIQTLGQTLGLAADEWRTLDAFRAKRHKAQYEGMDNVSEKELLELRAIVELLLREVETRLPAQVPKP
jgi:hypothetical protein